jgi:hypothetical protein
MKRLIILTVVLYVSAAAAASDANLVGWWKFDEGTGTVAYDSAGDNDATLRGEPNWVPGLIGNYALDFNGVHDRIVVEGSAGHDSPLDIYNSDLTISAWIKTRGTGIRSIVCRAKPLYITYHVRIEPTNQVSINTYKQGSGHWLLTTDEVLAENVWYHIAGVFDRTGDQGRVYVNGIKKAEGAMTTDPLSNDATTKIGCVHEETSDSYYFNGIIDDLRIYNRVLSSEEIQQLYEEGLPALRGLEITGPDEVAENSAASYKAIAHYDNGTTKDVTALAEWSVEPNTIATIESGQLTTEQVLYPKPNVTVYAQFTENEITVEAEKQVSVFAVCPIGTALRFDGQNDFVSVPNNSQLNITGDITISAWIWLARGGAGDDYSNQVIVAKTVGRGARDNPFDFRTEGIEPHLTLVRADASGHDYVYSTETIFLKQWHHVLVKVENEVPDFYLDGAITGKTVQSFTRTPTGNTKPLLIGRRDDGLYFDGIMDDVRIYNRALSAEEIEEVMLSKPTGSEPNLVAYWDFDEGEGQTAQDVSGNGNNGTLGSSSEPDAADPCWVESDAPFGQCTAEQVLGRNLFGATEDKVAANQLITDAKAKERASVKLIDELRKQMKGKDLFDALRARALVNIATVQEEMASRQINMTIEWLEEALCLLGYEEEENREPCGWPWPNCSHNQPNPPYGPGR